MVWDWYKSEKHTALISPGWWQSVLQAIDLDLEFFQFFDDCGIELFMVQAGIKANTIPGIFSYLTNLYYLWLKVFTDLEWQNNVAKDINKANFSGKITDWEKVGYHVGEIASELTEYQVPSIEYLYGDSIMKDNRASNKASKQN